jgi:uncharacterized protein with HEPN domain
MDLKLALEDRLRVRVDLVTQAGLRAKQIPQDVRDSHPEIAWRRIAGMRDVLAHAYFSLEDDTLWLVISESVHTLHRQLNAINLNQEPTP